MNLLSPLIHLITVEHSADLIYNKSKLIKERFSYEVFESAGI